MEILFLNIFLFLLSHCQGFELGLIRGLLQLFPLPAIWLDELGRGLGIMGVYTNKILVTQGGDSSE